MSAIYLVEGADGTGKTTFVEKTSAQYPDARVIHNGPEDAKLPGSLYRHYRAQILDAIWFRDELDIATFIDRSYPSELVYGNTFRKKSRISARQARKLDRLAASNGIIMMGFHASGKVRRERIVARGETWDDLNIWVSAKYRVYFGGEARSPWITVDSTSTPVTH